ncbi:MAG: hypothetical protein ABI606_18490 [Rhodoferax sp.]
MDAIRLRANRLKVWKKGKVVAQAAAVVARLQVAGNKQIFVGQRSGYSEDHPSWLYASMLKL